MEFIIKTQGGCTLIFKDDSKEAYFLTLLDVDGAELSNHIIMKDDIKRLAKAS